MVNELQEGQAAEDQPQGRLESGRPCRSGMGQEIILKASGLTKKFGSQTAVDGVSFSVRRGDVFGFLGPNGSGKSTTIGMILGLIEPTEGRIELFGLGPERRGEALARVGAIIESPTFYPYLSAFDNLSVLAALRGGIPGKRIREVLDLVGLSDAAGKRYGKFSLGMKQRLGIAWTLLHDPELVILDEPTNGLDPAGMIDVRHLIRRLAEAGKTVVLSSHLLHEVEQVCNRVAIIRRGRIVAEGEVSELVNRENRTVIRTPDIARAASVLRDIDGLQHIEVGDGVITVTAPSLRPSDFVHELVLAGVAVDEVTRAGSNLERIFLEITGAEGGVGDSA